VLQPCNTPQCRGHEAEHRDSLNHTSIPPFILTLTHSQPQPRPPLLPPHYLSTYPSIHYLPPLGISTLSISIHLLGITQAISQQACLYITRVTHTLTHTPLICLQSLPHVRISSSSTRRVAVPRPACLPSPCQTRQAPPTPPSSCPPPSVKLSSSSQQSLPKLPQRPFPSCSGHNGTSRYTPALPELSLTPH
jgi:hypothetical protein